MPRPDFASEERLIQQLDRESRDRTERVKAMLREEGRPELADQLDQKIKDIDSGVQGARSTWHSISDTQRRVLLLLAGGSQRQLARAGDVYSIRGSGTADDPAKLIRTGIRRPTVRALASRGLLEWTGGAFDPEAAAVLTEQARFVLKHGRPAPGEHFPGFRP